MLVGCGVWINLLKKDISVLAKEVDEQKTIVALKDVQINSFMGAIDRQNLAINKMAVDTNASLNEIKVASGTIEHRYDTINVEVKDKTCEAKLQVYENLLKAFPWKK